MDRLNRSLAGWGLALSLMLSATGCRTPRSEVPPSPSFTGDGQAAVGFNKEPNPVSSAAGLPGANSQYGTPSPSTAPSYGPAGNGGFGAPGSNLGTPSTTTPGSAGLSNPAGASNPTTGIPQAGTGSTGPAAGIGVAPAAGPIER